MLIDTVHISQIVADSLARVQSTTSTDNEYIIDIVTGLSEYIGTKNTTIILILLVLNILITIANIVVPIIIKNKEKKIFSFQTKEKTRIDLYNNIYSTMWVIRNNYLFDQKSFTEAQEILRQKITIQSLYLEKDKIKIANEFLDLTRGEIFDISACEKCMAKFKNSVL